MKQIGLTIMNMVALSAHLNGLISTIMQIVHSLSLYRQAIGSACKKFQGLSDFHSYNSILGVK